MTMPPLGPWDPPQPDQDERGRDQEPGQQITRASGPRRVGSRLPLLVAGGLVAALLLGLLFLAVRDRRNDDDGRPATTSGANRLAVQV